MRACFLLLFAAGLYAQKSGADSGVESLLAVKRIYVEQLKGGAQADSLRELIIASLDSTKLFILTDNPERADAVLKGAADDRAFVDTFDSEEGVNDRETGGKSSGSVYSSKGGGYLGLGVGGNESHHIKDPGDPAQRGAVCGDLQRLDHRRADPASIAWRQIPPHRGRPAVAA
jgi:hypothetical protein